jgi:hypothetical protein
MVAALHAMQPPCILVILVILDHSLIFRVIIPDVVLMQLSSWEWAHSCSEHVEDSNKHINKKLCVKLVTYKNFLWCFSAEKFYNNSTLRWSIQELFAGMVRPHMVYYALILSIAMKQSTCQHTHFMATSDPQNELFRSSNREQYVNTEKPFISDTSSSLLCTAYSKHCCTLLWWMFAINAI